MNQIARCDWLPERARRNSPLGTIRCITQENFPKSFIDQVCSVKMAGYWPRFVFACSINQKITISEKRRKAKLWKKEKFCIKTDKGGVNCLMWLVVVISVLSKRVVVTVPGVVCTLELFRRGVPIYLNIYFISISAAGLNICRTWHNCPKKNKHMVFKTFAKKGKCKQCCHRRLRQNTRGYP